MIFTDSKGAPLILFSLLKKTNYHLISFDIAYLHHLALIAGHAITFQWIPAHCSILAYEKADEAARNGLQKQNYRRTYFTKSDASQLAKRLAFEEKKRLWNLSTHHYAFLLSIDPYLRTRLPSEIPRHLETLYHSLRLNSAYGNNLRYRFGQVDSAYCNNCGSIETVKHIMFECRAYADERALYEHCMHLLTQRTLSVDCVLGPFPSITQQRQVMKLLFAYLDNIGQLDKLGTP